MAVLVDARQDETNLTSLLCSHGYVGFYKSYSAAPVRPRRGAAVALGWQFIFHIKSAASGFVSKGRGDQQ